VVATGYGDRPLPRSSTGREPAGLAAREADREPRVTRAPGVSSNGAGLDDVEVPEFIPRR